MNTPLPPASRLRQLYATEFLVFTTIREQPVGNPNRGEDGQPKSCQIGKTRRSYRSPQNQKALIRHLRGGGGFDEAILRIRDSLGGEDLQQLSFSIRTRDMDLLLGSEIKRRKAAGGDAGDDIDPAKLHAAAQELKLIIAGGKKDREEKEEKETAKNKSDTKETEDEASAKGAIIVFGGPEMALIVDEVFKACREGADIKSVKAKIKTALGDKAVIWTTLTGMRKICACGLDGAIMGTMATNGRRPQADSAVAFGYEFSVHEADIFDDPFIAMDDLLPEGEHGAAHMDFRGLTSGLMMGTMMVDIGQLIRNVTANSAIRDNGRDWRTADEEDFIIASEIAGGVVSAWFEGNVTAMHSNSASATRPMFVLGEHCVRAPTSHAGAFFEAVSARRNDNEGLIRKTADRLATHIACHQRVYQYAASSAWLSTDEAFSEKFTETLPASGKDTFGDFVTWVRDTALTTAKSGA